MHLEGLEEEVVGVLSVALPDLLQHFEHDGLVEDGAEVVRVLEQDVDEVVLLQVVVLEEDEEEGLLALDLEQGALGQFHVEDADVLVLVVLVLPAVLELGEHQTDGTKDVHVVRIQSFQVLRVPHQFLVLLDDLVVLNIRDQQVVLLRYQLQNLDLQDYQFAAFIGNDELVEHVLVLDEQAELLEIDEFRYEYVHLLVDDLEEETMADEQDMFVILLEAQEDVLEVVVHQVDGELPLGVQHTGEVVPLLLVGELVVLEGQVEVRQLPFVVKFVTMLVDQLVDQIDVERVSVGEHHFVLHYLVHQQTQRHELEELLG